MRTFWFFPETTNDEKLSLTKKNFLNYSIVQLTNCLDLKGMNIEQVNLHLLNEARIAFGACVFLKKKPKTLQTK